ncbi:MAG: aminodeoxychorismate lyase [Steroidobacteraceae bacterium]
MTGAPDTVLFNGFDVADGAPQELRRACLSLLTDRGLHYGDGLFETIACRDGVPRFLGDHLKRLALGCERLAIELGSRGALVDDVLRLAAGRPRSLVKVIVTRGPATARGYTPRGDERASRIVLRYGWPDEDPRFAREGVAVRLAALTLAENPRLAGLKHLNRLEQVLARAELRGSGLDEALLLSRSGCLVSGTMTNVFVVSGSTVATPRLDRCGVAGVMRRVVMREAAATGIAVQEARITRQDVEAADEVFLTNVRIGIWPVRAVGARELGPGPKTRQLQHLIEPLLTARPAQAAGGGRC